MRTTEEGVLEIVEGPTMGQRSGERSGVRRALRWWGSNIAENVGSMNERRKRTYASPRREAAKVTLTWQVLETNWELGKRLQHAGDAAPRAIYTDMIRRALDVHVNLIMKRDVRYVMYNTARAAIGRQAGGGRRLSRSRQMQMQGVDVDAAGARCGECRLGAQGVLCLCERQGCLFAPRKRDGTSPGRGVSAVSATFARGGRTKRPQQFEGPAQIATRPEPPDVVHLGCSCEAPHSQPQNRRKCRRATHIQIRDAFTHGSCVLLIYRPHTSLPQGAPDVQCLPRRAIYEGPSQPSPIPRDRDCDLIRWAPNGRLDTHRRPVTCVLFCRPQCESHFKSVCVQMLTPIAPHVHRAHRHLFPLCTDADRKTNEPHDATTVSK